MPAGRAGGLWLAEAAGWGAGGVLALQRERLELTHFDTRVKCAPTTKKPGDCSQTDTKAQGHLAGEINTLIPKFFPFFFLFSNLFKENFSILPNKQYSHTDQAHLSLAGKSFLKAA